MWQELPESRASQSSAGKSACSILRPGASGVLSLRSLLQKDCKNKNFKLAQRLGENRKKNLAGEVVTLKGALCAAPACARGFKATNKWLFCEFMPKKLGARCSICLTVQTSRHLWLTLASSALLSSSKLYLLEYKQDITTGASA